MHFPSTPLAVMDIIRCRHAIQNSDQVTCTWGANELALVSFAIGKEQPPPPADKITEIEAADLRVRIE